jgi:hypothetical protein
LENIHVANSGSGNSLAFSVYRDTELVELVIFQLSQLPGRWNDRLNQRWTRFLVRKDSDHQI